MKTIINIDDEEFMKEHDSAITYAKFLREKYNFKELKYHTREFCD